MRCFVSFVFASFEVGYRVNSSKGVKFRKWANSVLKQYLINGYAINERRMAALQKTVEIQTKMLADTLNIEERDVLFAVQQCKILRVIFTILTKGTIYDSKKMLGDIVRPQTVRQAA